MGGYVLGGEGVLIEGAGRYGMWGEGSEFWW